MAYPGLVKGGCSALFVIFAHAQIVGRCGFEREYVRIVNLRSAQAFDRPPMHSGYLRRRLLSSHLALGLCKQCPAASRTLHDCNE